MQISPQKSFPLIWNSADPADIDTLYVQVVVKDGSTGATLDTINLIDKGSNLFMKDYITPHDPSQTGTGRWITVVYTVYTDAGYTTKSQNYSRITEKYLVKRLLDTEVAFGAGGGIDYKELRKIVKEELAKQEPPEIPEKLGAVEPPEIDLTPIITELKKEIQSVSTKVDNIKFPEIPETPEKVDLSPLRSSFRIGLERVLRQVKVLPQAPNYSVELGEIKSAFQELNKLENLQKEIAKDRDTLEKYNELLLSLDSKMGILTEVLKQVDETGLAGRKDVEGIMETLKKIREVPRKRMLWKV